MARITIPDEYQSKPATYAFATFIPEVSRAHLRLSKAVYSNAIISLREFEAARGRVALINGCETCQKFRSARDVPGYLAGFGETTSGSVAASGDPEPDEGFYANLANWRESNLYSERERLAIDLAERFSINPTSADNDEEFWARLTGAYSDEEIFSLMLSIGAWITGGRILHMLQFDNVCSVVP